MRKLITAGMPIAFYAYLAPEIFEKRLPLGVHYDEPTRTVRIDLRKLDLWPSWMEKLVIQLGPDRSKDIVLDQSVTGPSSAQYSIREGIVILSTESSTPDP